MHMAKTYLIDVVIRDQDAGATEGHEPVIAVTRIGVRIPETMKYPEIARALGEEVHKFGAHLIKNNDELSLTLDHYDAAMEEEVDLTEVPPEFRPN